MPFPGHKSRRRIGVFGEARMKKHAGYDEEAKDDDLHEETDDDDLLAEFVEVQRSRGLNASSASLQRESDNVAGNEYFRHPLDGDEGEVLSVHGANQASEDHVDGSCEEGWGDEDEDCLDDEATYGFLVVVRPNSTGVAYCLDWAKCNISHAAFVGLN